MKKLALIALGLASLVLAGFFFSQRHPRELAARHNGPHEAGPGSLVDALDDDGHRVTFRIESIAADPRDSEGETHLYGLSIKIGETWEPYCAPDADGRRAAIPLTGSWDVTAPAVRVDAGPDTLTFACTSGAIGKCVRFGYKPWKADDGAMSLGALHAACVRMVRADYCGDGRAHTVNGTLIDVYDRRGIQKADADPQNREQLEAGWSPTGATYLNVPRRTDDVAAIVAECPEHFAHRTSLDESLTADQVAQHFPETLLYDNRMRNE